MRKRIFTTIFALIGLSSIVVLGSTTKFIDQILASINGGTSGSVINSERRQELNVSSAGKEQQEIASIKPTDMRNTVIQTSRNSVSNGREIETPEHILWGVIFRYPEKFERLAEAARQRGKSDALWTGGFVRKTKLSLENAEIFKEKAMEYSKEMLPVTERSREIGLQYKLARESGKRVPNDKALRKELSELQEKKKELALKYRDEFRKAIDEEAFTAFEEWLKTEFVKNFHTRRISGKDIYKAKVESGEFSPTGKNNPEDHHK